MFYLLWYICIVKYLRKLRAHLGLLKFKFFKKLNALMGYSIVGLNDYSSPLFNKEKILLKQERWDKPSSFSAIEFNLKEIKTELLRLLKKYNDELEGLPSEEEIARLNLGPGIPRIDGLLLYMMIRDIKPKQYVEVGSGLSSYYCWLAAKKNKKEGFPLKITCIDPNPYPALLNLRAVTVIPKEVQDIPVSFFKNLSSGDVLFIDSTHVIKVDGDVSYMYLEVLPTLKNGVIIQSHDTPFPYNIPYPAKFRIIDNEWPSYWNEAMMVQAFLSYNQNFKIIMSMPIIRFSNEQFLKKNFPNYRAVDDDPDTFSSLWYKKIR